MTYTAPAHDGLARVMHDPDEAAKACALIEGVEAPLAAGRVLATAFELGLVRAAQVSRCRCRLRRNRILLLTAFDPHLLESW